MWRTVKPALCGTLCRGFIRPPCWLAAERQELRKPSLSMKTSLASVEGRNASNLLTFAPSKLPQTANGRVMSAQANHFRVKLLSTNEEGRQIPQVELLCRARSMLGKVGRFILVGDYVQVINIDWQDARGLVSSIESRSSEIVNPKIANVDHFALVFALADPPFEPFQVTRFLVEAESIGVPCTLLLNKADLVDDATVRANVERIKEWGYNALPVSVESGQGLDQLRQLLVNKTTVLAGPSGVGKSSIINYLRREALSSEQQERLQKFQDMMDTESDWRFVTDDSDDSDGDVPSSPEPGSSAGQTHDKQHHPLRVADVGTTGCGDDAGDADEVRKRETSAGVVGARPGREKGSSGAALDGPSSAFARNVPGEVSPRESDLDELEYHIPAWASGDDKIYGAQAVANVGYKSRRGRHTTRNVVLLDMPGGGILADTPGFNYPSILMTSAATVQQHFPEIKALKAVSPCAFANCTHVHEPDCSVRSTPWERYEFYVRLLEEIRDREQMENTKLQMQKRRRQGLVKQKQGSGGKDIELARLDPKKHRRASRGSRKLAVKGLLNDLDDDRL